jgi:hypothetical protein
MIKRLFYIALSTALLFSCSVRLDGVLRPGGQAELEIRAALEPKTADLIRSLQALMGGAPGGRIIDGPALARSLAAAPGIASVTLNNTGPTAVAGSITISRLDQFLAVAGNESRRFVTWQESGGGGSIKIAMDHDSAPGILALISPDIVKYLEALMAPAATGDRMTRAEYLSLAGSFYGKTVADEMAAARIRLSLDFPRPIKQISGGTAAGSRALFDLPLVDFLVLENPLVYEVSW